MSENLKPEVEPVNPVVAEKIKTRIKSSQDPYALGDRIIGMINSSALSPETKNRLSARFNELFFSALAEIENPNGHQPEPATSIYIEHKCALQIPLDGNNSRVIFKRGLDMLPPPQRVLYQRARAQRKLGYESGKDGRPKVINPHRIV